MSELLEYMLKADQAHFESMISFLDADFQIYQLIESQYQAMGNSTEMYDPDLEKQKNLLMLLFRNCSYNHTLGSLTLLRGHLSDSMMYLRRAVESFGYAFASVDEPRLCNLWHSTDREPFRKAYSKWQNKGGREKLQKNFEFISNVFDQSSALGTHSNLFFSAFHTVPFERDGQHGYAFYMHDADNPQVRSHVRSFFLYVQFSHANLIDWWLTNPGFRFELDLGPRSEWQKTRNSITVRMAQVKATWDAQKRR